MRTVLLTGLSCLVLYSCKKVDITDPSQNKVNNAEISVASVRNNPDSQYVPTTKTVNFLSKKTADAGDITVSNDGVTLSVKITMQGGALLKKSFVYIGNMANVPRKHDGKVDEEHFPYKHDNGGHGVITYTYNIPVNGLPDCFIIMVKGEVKDGPSGKAWAEGPDLPGSNKATYFDYCLLTSQSAS